VILSLLHFWRYTVRIATLARTFAAAALLVVPLILTPASAAAEPDPGDKQGPHEQRGCPAGAVCIYPNAGWNNNRPSLVFWSYGAHNLSNQTGRKRIYNNQIQGAKARTCDGYDGKDCLGYLFPGESVDLDFTPINSVVLVRGNG
jgi:hypothetical protein